MERQNLDACVAALMNRSHIRLFLVVLVGDGSYVACEPYFDIATRKLANDVPMDVNDNNASTSSSGCSPKIEQCCFVSPFVNDESLRFSLLALAHLFIPVLSAVE
jgi:hypothetical protein